MPEAVTPWRSAVQYDHRLVAIRRSTPTAAYMTDRGTNSPTDQFGVGR